MSKHEDQFFNMFRDNLKDFSPEVPDAVYSGIRKKMRRRGFFTFSFNSLNFWYLALAAGVFTAVATTDLSTESNSMAYKSIDNMDEVISKPNNHLLSTLSETELDEEVLTGLNSNIAEVHNQNTSTKHGDSNHDTASKGGHDDGKTGDDQANGSEGNDNKTQVEDIIVETPVIETHEIASNLFHLHEIGKMKYSLKNEIEKEDVIKIKVPIPSKK